PATGRARRSAVRRRQPELLEPERGGLALRVVVTTVVEEVRHVQLLGPGLQVLGRGYEMTHAVEGSQLAPLVAGVEVGNRRPLAVEVAPRHAQDVVEVTQDPREKYAVASVEEP